MTLAEAAAPRAGEITCDEALFERLRTLRKSLADERGVPPYIIFSDVGLRQMARFYPATDPEFLRISGVGERKLAEFGKVFLAEIAAFLQTHPRQIFAEDRILTEPRRAKLGRSGSCPGNSPSRNWPSGRRLL